MVSVTAIDKVHVSLDIHRKELLSNHFTVIVKHTHSQQCQLRAGVGSMCVCVCVCVCVCMCVRVGEGGDNIVG